VETSGKTTYRVVDLESSHIPGVPSFGLYPIPGVPPLGLFLIPGVPPLGLLGIIFPLKGDNFGECFRKQVCGFAVIYIGV
jgi:hypothetical protein